MKRYHVTTFGCQMNAHDSERIGGMFEQLGLEPAASREEADVVVFNTCTVRDRPDRRLYNQLEQVQALKRRDPDRIIAVGGCLVEAQQQVLFRQFPFVDVAFGPGHIARLGEFVASATKRGVGSGALPDTGTGFFGVGEEREFAADLPVRRERGAQAWVQVSMGCNMTCSYCIVPAVRGREKSRAATDIVGEVTALARDGVREVTLLGQNVNSYGRDIPRASRVSFAELLRSVDAIDGIDRVRFTSPHPKDMRDDVIAAMAECPAVCEQLHLPVQSGSSRVLKAMRRTYTRDRFLELAARIREQVPEIALTTDIIVGFPTETEAEFLETVSLCEQVGFDGAFTFIYSPRSGTEAAGLPDLPFEEKRRRLEHLIDVVRGIASDRNAAQVGTVREVLVEGAARSGEGLRRGRTRQNITVNFEGDAPEGTLVDVLVTSSTSETLAGTQQDGPPR